MTLARCFDLARMVIVVATATAAATAHGEVLAGSWFVQAGAAGDGKSAERPAGSVESLDRVTGERDRIFLLPSDTALDGGISLKVGQQLIGLDQEGRKPVITNTKPTVNLGCGVVLANASSVSNVRIENTSASGLYGRNVSGVRVAGVDIHGANRSEAFIEATFPTLPGSLPHGGIVFVHSGSQAEVEATASTVTQAAGFGIVSITSGVAQARLSVNQTHVLGGSKVGVFDAGISALVKDPEARSRLEISDSEVNGRLSRSGRNVMIVASGGGRAEARIERSVSGPAGQDGIVGAVMQSPSRITIQIVDSLIEDAGQMNVEGSLVNLPPEGSASADAGRISIEIERSTIRNAGAVSGFEDVAANVWLGGSRFLKDAPPTTGNYTLRIKDSRIEGAGGAGLEFGNKNLVESGYSETSEFDVVLRGSSIANNGEADLKLYAPRARIDARKNCWGRPDGLARNRSMVVAPAERSQLDASVPLSCAEDTQGYTRR